MPDDEPLALDVAEELEELELAFVVLCVGVAEIATEVTVGALDVAGWLDAVDALVDALALGVADDVLRVAVLLLEVLAA